MTKMQSRGKISGCPESSLVLNCMLNGNRNRALQTFEFIGNMKQMKCLRQKRKLIWSTKRGLSFLHDKKHHCSAMLIPEKLNWESIFYLICCILYNFSFTLHHVITIFFFLKK